MSGNPRGIFRKILPESSEDLRIKEGSTAAGGNKGRTCELTRVKPDALKVVFERLEKQS
jgi:hypothetical protein